MKNKITKKDTINLNNIDKKEIEKFNTLSKQWWNNSGAFQSLHHINSIRFNYIIKNSNGLFGKKVLDVGCGGGILSEHMARAGAKVTGLDVSICSLKIASSHALNENLIIHYLPETIEQHAQKYKNYYDVITCMEILEHVPNPISIIHSCHSLIKSKGFVFFSTINRTFKSWLLIIIGAEYILNILPKGSHNFKKFVTPAELLSWIDSTSLEEKNITGIYYNPFTYQCAFTSNINTNYILCTQCK